MSDETKPMGIAQRKRTAMYAAAAAAELG